MCNVSSKINNMFTHQGLFGFDQTNNFEGAVFLLQSIIRCWWQRWIEVSLSDRIMDTQETL